MREAGDELRAKRSAGEFRGVQDSARRGREPRRHEFVAPIAQLERRFEQRRQQAVQSKHTARIGHRQRRLRRHVELVAHGMHDRREFLRRRLEQPMRRRVTRARRLRHQRRERGDLAAREGRRTVDGGAQVEIRTQPKTLTDQIVKSGLGRSPIAHAGEQRQCLAGDPVGGALVTEQLSPAAGARASRPRTLRRQWSPCRRRY